MSRFGLHLKYFILFYILLTKKIEKQIYHQQLSNHICVGKCIYGSVSISRYTCFKYAVYLQKITTTTTTNLDNISLHYIPAYAICLSHKKKKDLGTNISWSTNLHFQKLNFFSFLCSSDRNMCCCYQIHLSHDQSGDLLWLAQQAYIALMLQEKLTPVKFRRRKTFIYSFLI